ncbi:hypothetical protein R3W88_031749 [Solanum pinnatisectum]|uniref:Uncharacterized protein n=1 Tax=Solanum pinnatisectum TaxID=50273 RepID=A0AAV9LM92_9SOLN|nr:hypothetical protein R3W88_031749 [Solanum pinnatisectum]
MVESGIKSRKIVSQAVLKATTQVLQNSSSNLGGKKRKGRCSYHCIGPLDLCPRQSSTILFSFPNPTISRFISSISHLYKNLRALNVLSPIDRKILNLHFIDTHRIIVESLNEPSINQKPLSMHIETNMLEMMNDKEEFASHTKNLTNVVGLTKTMHPEAQNMLKILCLLNTPIITMKGEFEDVWESQRKAKMVVQNGAEQAYIDHSRGLYSLNYKPTIVTYKGNEVNEEVDEVGGMMHSWRYYAPIELRKTKRNDKKFLRKMKLLDYSIVEQLKKTPTQISLLSLLIHCDEHCKAIIKILNEAHVPNEVTISQLQKILGKIFESKIHAIGEIELILKIGHASYNLLLGRPWVHRVEVFPSILHQMINEGDLSIYKNSSIPFVMENNVIKALVYQDFEVVVVEHILEGNLISKP